MDRVAEAYQGRVTVASIDVGQPAGTELGRLYGTGPKDMAVIFFDRNGKVAEKAPTVTEEEAKQILDRLLEGK